MSKISELSDGGVIQGGDTLIAVRSGGNVKVTYGGSTTANIDGGTIDGTTIGGTTPAAGNFTTGSFTGNVSFGDNDKAIFGAGSDLQIYHTGTNSILKNLSGDFILQGNGITLRGNSPTETMVTGTVNGAVTLHYDSVERLATTSTGIDVTGTVTADGLTVDGSGAKNIRVGSTDGSGAKILLDGSSNGDFLGGDYSIIQNLGTKLSIIGGTLNAPIELETHDGSSNKLRQKIADNGDISFYEDTGTTAKLFWDASAESLGIGTSSVESLLTIDKDVSTAYDSTDDSAQRSNTNTLLLKNEDGTANSFAQIAFDLAGSGQSIARIVGLNDGTSSSALAFVTEGSNTKREVMRLDGSGLVGIGTDSPAYSLTVGDGTDASEYLQLKTTNTGTGGILFGDSDANFPAYLWYNHSGNRMEFGVNGGERMRIDSSGNAMFNTTNVDPSGSNVIGTALLQYGGASMSRVNSITLDLNRDGSDGAVINLRKSGTSVGSIGTELGRLFVGSNDSMIFFDAGSTNAIWPWTSTATSDGDADNTIDIGDSNNRFKDLYLSGGVYLGGTGSANKLDDYEEGTWTPAFTPTTGSFTTITTVSTGRYTKVGRLVTLFATIRTSGTLDVTGASGNLKITGLPFTCNSTIAGGGADLSHQGWDIGILNTRMYIEAGTNFIVMYDNAMNQSSFPSANIVVSDMSTSGGSFANLISFTASYEV